MILGATYGDPNSVGTYSGVPYHLFAELDRRSCLAGRVNIDQRRRLDFLRGNIDIQRCIESRRPIRNAYWRFLPENIRRLTQRVKPVFQAAPPHDVILQIGVGGVPTDRSKVFAAHAEISVETAATTPAFSSSYGFLRTRDRYLKRANEGERQFLTSCDLIWTNTSWTANTFAHHGLPPDKFWVHAPACNTDDPGLIERRDSPPHLLFMGKDWIRKGGPCLVEAFKILRKHEPEAKLTIIGCVPPVDGPGITIHGFLDKSNARDSRLIDVAFRQATMFCMLSQWESVGLVYMEAAIYGLPVVMLEGQGRQEVFPEKMAIHLKESDPRTLADILLAISKDRTRTRSMGEAGRAHILENYTWPVVAQRLCDRIQQAKLERSL